MRVAGRAVSSAVGVPCRGLGFATDPESYQRGKTAATRSCTRRTHAPLARATRCNFQPPAEAGGRRQVSRSAPQAPGNKAIIEDGERETTLSVWATDAGHVVRGVHRRHGRSALGLLRLPISGHAAVCVARPVRGRRNSRVVPAGEGRAERWCVRIGRDTAEKGRAARAFARSRKSDQVCVPNCLLTFGCSGAHRGRSAR